MGRLDIEEANGSTRLNFGEQMGRLDFEGANGSTRLDFGKQMGRLDFEGANGSTRLDFESKWVDSILREQMGRLDSIWEANGSTRFREANGSTRF